MDSFPRLSNEENNICLLLGKDSDLVELEGKQFKKLGKSRSRIGKMKFPFDCSGGGDDGEGDHNSPGVPSSPEEKVSSLKTGLVHVARKMPKNAHVHFILGLMYQRMGQPQKKKSCFVVMKILIGQICFLWFRLIMHSVFCLEVQKIMVREKKWRVRSLKKLLTS